MILLDGSYGEGGGQILRTAFLLSLLTDQPFRIENIRRGRPQPGLKPQHLHIGRALLQMGKMGLSGLTPGSLELTFYPAPLRGGVYELTIGTAGAIPLFLQTILPAALFADSPVTFTVTGGTDVRGAMSMDFWQAVLLPFLRPYAQQVALDIQRRGFYPIGGGRVQLKVTPQLSQHNWASTRSNFPPLALAERGELQRIQVFSQASTHLRERKVATRQAAACYNALPVKPQDPHIAYSDSSSPGSVITVVAEYAHTRLGADLLGEQGKPSEQIGTTVAQRLQQEVQGRGTVDVHTADNLLVWLALFGGRYHFAEATGHLTTNAWVIEHFLPGAVQLGASEAVAV